MSTGVGRLDSMLGDGGFYKGSTVLINGTAGTGKSTLAAQFCDATCRGGRRAMYFAFEESETQIVRNMASVGIGLQQWIDAGLLQFRCSRPSLLGLEAHLFAIQRFVGEFDPAVVVMDPVSDLLRIGTGADVSAMLTRQVDYLKARGVTTLFTNLASDAETAPADEQITSLVDTSILVKTMEGNGELNRVLYVTKSRGMAHSNQIREFLLTDQGIELADVYVGPQGVLTGSARQAQEAQERSDGTARLEGLEQRRAGLETRREAVEAQTAALWREFEDEADVVGRLLSHASTGVEDRAGQRAEQGRLRRADADEPEPDRDRCAMTRFSEAGHRRRRDGRGLAPAALRRGSVTEVAAGVRQPQGPVRRAPGRALRDRGHRPRGAAGAGPRRRHPRHPDARPPPAGAAAEDHRRPLEHRARPRRPAHRAEARADDRAAGRS